MINRWFFHIDLRNTSDLSRFIDFWEIKYLDTLIKFSHNPIMLGIIVWKHKPSTRSLIQNFSSEFTIFIYKKRLLTT